MEKEIRNTYRKAKIKCRLDENELRMAAELGIPPDKLLSMIPNRNESWKDPVALRIRRLYDRVQAKKRPEEKDRRRSDET